MIFHKERLWRISTWFFKLRLLKPHMNSGWTRNLFLHSLTWGRGQLLAGMGRRDDQKPFPCTFGCSSIVLWKTWNNIHILSKSVVSVDGSTGVKGLQSRHCYGAPCWGHNSPEAPWRPHGVGSDECGSRGAPSVRVCMSETVHSQTAFGVIMRNGPISQSRQWSVKRTHTNTCNMNIHPHMNETDNHTSTY